MHQLTVGDYAVNTLSGEIERVYDTNHKCYFTEDLRTGEAGSYRKANKVLVYVGREHA